MIIDIISLALLVVSVVVDAAPVKIKRATSGLLHIPLSGLRSLDGTENAATHLQGHIHRSQRRLARMTGKNPHSIDRKTGDGDTRKRLFLPTMYADATKQTRRFKRVGSVSSSSRRHKKSSLLRRDDDEDEAESTTISNNFKPAAANTVKEANTPVALNSIGLSIEANDAGYIATVQIGTPPQDFKVLVDSGSADFWVTGENCQDADGASCGNHTVLGSHGSSSFIDTGIPYNVSYGSGNLTGNIISDRVKIGQLSLEKHVFGNAIRQSVQMIKAGGAFDGIMGLGQSFLSSQKHLTVVDSLAMNGQLSEPIVSYFISRLADDKNNGQVTFGGMDSTKFDPTTMVTMNNISPKGFWEAALDGVAVDDIDMGFTNRTAILDTGTSLILVPPEDAVKIYNAIPDSQQISSGFTIPCNTKTVVSLKFAGSVFTIDPRDLVQLPLDSSGLRCTSGIAAGLVGGQKEFLVGDVFLKNAYFSTNSNTNKLSLAKLMS